MADEKEHPAEPTNERTVSLMDAPTNEPTPGVPGQIAGERDSIAWGNAEEADAKRASGELRLWVSVNGGWSHFTVTFSGRDKVVDARAVAWMDTVADRMSFEAHDPESIDWSRFPRTYEHLNPTCEHGLSAWLCMGPMHYPTREQEMAGEYF